MLDEHDPPVFGLYEVEDLFYLLATISESIFHHFSGDVALLVREQDDSRALDVGALERLHPSRESIVKNTEAYDAAFMFVRHVAPLVLGTTTQCASVPLVFGQYCILVIEHDYISPANLSLKVDGGNNLAGINQFYALSTDVCLEFFPYWIACGSGRKDPERCAVVEIRQ